MARNSRISAMIYLLWNCRGLRLNTVVRALHRLIKQYRPSVIFLSEIKMKNHRIEGVRRRIGYQMGFDVPLSGTAGGLSLWWNDNMEINVLRSSKNLVHSEMHEWGEVDWLMAAWIYGNLYESEKEYFWRWIMNELETMDIP